MRTKELWHDFTRLRHRKGPSAKGFTIIELLVVVGIIGIFISMAVMAFRGGGDTVGLQSAQRTLASIVSAARSHAAMNQTTVLIAVNDDPTDRENYLRQIWILRKHPNTNAQLAATNELPPGDQTISDNWNWLPLGEPIRLSAGIFVVPTPNTRVNPGPPPSTINLRPAGRLLPQDFFNDYDQSPNETQRGNRKSNAAIRDLYINYHDTENPNRVPVMTFSFNSRGFAGGGHRIVTGVAERTQTGPRFLDSEQIVGMLVRPFGSTTLVTEAQTFDTN